MYSTSSGTKPDHEVSPSETSKESVGVNFKQTQLTSLFTTDIEAKAEINDQSMFHIGALE